MEPPDNIFYSGTFFGEALSLAASIATIKKLEKGNIIEKLWKTGTEIISEATYWRKYHNLDDDIWLEGFAPRYQVKFRNDDIAALFRKEMVNSGTLITNSHNVSAAHGLNEVKRIGKSYEHACRVLREAIDKGDIKERLAGAAISQGVRT